METQYDDDSFYAEIRRQILLLTSEENEDLLERKSTGVFIPQPVTCTPVEVVYKSASLHASNLGSWENESSGSPPDWLVNLWKSGNEKEKGTGVFIPQGTGVFIPQATYRRKHRPGTNLLHVSIEDGSVGKRIESFAYEFTFESLQEQ